MTASKNKFSFDRFTRQLTSAHIYLFLIVSAVLWIVVDQVRIPGIIDHPQFTELMDKDFLYNALVEKKKLVYYRLFFVIDFIWTFGLLLGILFYVKGKFLGNLKSVKTNDPTANISWKKGLFFTFFIIASFAYVFDVIENILYLYSYHYSENLVIAKIVAYAIVFIVFILALVHYTLGRFANTLLRFLTAAVYSLIILVILGSFLPKATQVNSIVVNLYEQPRDLLILFLFAPIYAVVLAHNPSYFKIDEDQRHWFMNRVRWVLLGTVFYKYRKGARQTVVGKKEDQVNFLYRILGILFYAALIYMLGYTSQVNFDWNISVSKIAALSLVLGIVLLYELKKIKENWFAKTTDYLITRLPGNYDGDNPQMSKDSQDMADVKKPKKRSKTEMEADLLSIKPPVALFVSLFGFTVLLHVILMVILVFCKECRYTEWTAIWSLVCIFMQLISFVYYRTFRSVLRYVFYKDCNAILNAFYIIRDIKLIETASNPQSLDVTLRIECKKKFIYTFFDDHDFSIKHWYFDFAKFLGTGTLSNNVTFLQINIFVGIVNAVFFVLININSELSIHFNPILIILSGLFFYYGVLVVVTKHIIYYNSSEEEYANRNKGRFNFLVVLCLVLLCIGVGLEEKFTNNLFTLPLIERHTEEEVTFATYVSDLPEDQVRYYIGCYGGGMKSNAWTMTVLNELYRRDNDFFKKTVGISGASGGTVGLINMAAIMNANKNEVDKWPAIIESISTENILSLDLTHILGRDFINAVFVPILNLSGKDRSTKAMERYAAMTNNQVEINTPTSYRAYWKQLYKNYGNQYPILISNSTNVEGNGGMAVSVSVDDSLANAILYQGADDILEIIKQDYDSLGTPGKRNKKTLGYFDAASTSNRFPLLSPAAKIETKGHFNDGGIYENAGLLSAFKLFKAVNYCENVENLHDLKQRNIFISIVNDKNQYIKYRLAKEKMKIEVNKVTEHVELSAMLSSIVATEMLPIHVKAELRTLEATYDSIQFETIYLPHRFNMADIKAIYGEELEIGIGVAQTGKKLFKATQDNDVDIKKELGISEEFWTTPIIEPPMSRVMAAEAYRFMYKMLGHQDIDTVLTKISEQQPRTR